MRLYKFDVEALISRRVMKQGIRTRYEVPTQKRGDKNRRNKCFVWQYQLSLFETWIDHKTFGTCKFLYLFSNILFK